MEKKEKNWIKKVLTWEVKYDKMTKIEKFCCQYIAGSFFALIFALGIYSTIIRAITLKFSGIEIGIIFIIIGVVFGYFLNIFNIRKTFSKKGKKNEIV